MATAAQWVLVATDTFEADLTRLPKAVRHAYLGEGRALLRTQPETPAIPKVKKLGGYKDLWRLRLGKDYRLVYRVARNQQTVTLLMAGHRDGLYARLDTSDSDQSPGIRIIANAPGLLERQPTAVEQGRAMCALAQQGDSAAPATQNKNLPRPLDTALLTEWSIPAQYHAAFASCHTENDLMALSGKVLDRDIERVMNGLWPKAIEDVVEEPVRVLDTPEALMELADGRRDLTSFLLLLDDEQKEFVDRFERNDNQGPWLLKGGPGSGKSTVALYCVRALVKAHESRLDGSIRILLTSFTNSLTNASKVLFHSMAKESAASVEFMTVDALAKSHLPRHTTSLALAKDQLKTILKTNWLNITNGQDVQPFTATKDAAFVAEEVDWVIIGQNLKDIGSYLSIDRSGRGRGLNDAQRRALWRIYEGLCKFLRARQECLLGQRLVKAVESAKQTYDYVFVDEAQDLKPIALKLCIAVCKDSSRVFLTADTNQCIYGTGLSWSKATEGLRLAGRTRILRRNYRTTKEIWEAVKQIAPTSSIRDRETLDEVRPVYNGPCPLYVNCADSQQLEHLNRFLRQSLLAERVPPACAAVLCPTNDLCKFVAARIEAALNPAPMVSAEVNLTHPGVKVMTMHAAKGLQFPVVAVWGIKAGQFPWAASGGINEDEWLAQLQRVFFVGCSRAMRRLAVYGSATKPSPFTAQITDTLWEVHST